MAAGHSAEGTEPSSDAASAEFRVRLARVLTERALIEAMAEPVIEGGARAPRPGI